MSQSHSQSVARILAAPWQQRVNASGVSGVVLVVALCYLAPVVLFAIHVIKPLLSLTHDQSTLADITLIAAVRSFWVGTGALLIAGWAMLVGNVLQQNHPTIARLVPHHASQLRVALLVAWALIALVAAALPGYAFDAPLAWACGIAAVAATLAACLRWPLLWLLGIAAPFVVGWFTRHYSAQDVIDALADTWSAHEIVIGGVVITAGAATLVGLVRHGGQQHSAAYEQRKRLRQVVLEGQQGCGQVAVSSRWGWIAGMAVDGRPYAWWMRRQLARADSPVMSRLLLGLGPATHWTSRVFQAFWFVVASVVACAVMSLFIGADMFGFVLPWLGFSMLTGLCTPALQCVPQLRQTQREQALLMLLPGVPRGARLNRWLAWQMSAAYLVAAVVACLVALALTAWGNALHPGASQSSGDLNLGIAAVLLPQVAWQWRYWARLYGATGSVSQAPTLIPFLLGGGAVALHISAHVSYLTIGVVMAVAAIAYCAWRWVRMGSEPSAFPIGRLS